MGKIEFLVGDLYPSPFGGVTSKDAVNPDKDDLEALNENREEIEETKMSAGTKNILLGVAMIACLAVFFGVN